MQPTSVFYLPGGTMAGPANFLIWIRYSLVSVSLETLFVWQGFQVNLYFSDLSLLSEIIPMFNEAPWFSTHPSTLHCSLIQFHSTIWTWLFSNFRILKFSDFINSLPVSLGSKRNYCNNKFFCVCGPMTQPSWIFICQSGYMMNDVVITLSWIFLSQRWWDIAILFQITKYIMCNPLNAYKMLLGISDHLALSHFSPSPEYEPTQPHIFS